MRRRGRSHLILVCGAVILMCLTAHPEAVAEDESIPEWKLKGYAAALADPSPEVFKAAIQFPDAPQLLKALGPAAKEQAPRLAKLLGDPDENVRRAAAKALGALGPAAKEQAPRLAQALGDPDREVRWAAAEALGALGPAARDQAPRLAKLLDDPDENACAAAAEALEALGPLGRDSILGILELVYGHMSLAGELRFHAHFLAGGDPAMETLIAWFGRPEHRPTKALTDDPARARDTLHTFKDAWPATAHLPYLRSDLANHIGSVVKAVQWRAEDLPLLRAFERHLREGGMPVAAAVERKIDEIEARQRIDWRKVAGYGWVAHAAFWLVLIFVYPRSTQIQAIFFWNPWVRRFFGLGYIGLALAWVPFLRAKLFAPFRDSLRADAALDRFDEDAYFPDSEVKVGPAGACRCIVDAIPEIKGEIVLEGESGLGKTMFLRHLVGRSKRIVVYLPAVRCDHGVVEAIQAKLHGPAGDPKFLRHLIYAGAIDICIDGLNEVSADTRAKVTGFAESYFKGNIILSTQPMEWSPPATAKVCVLQPLKPEQIKAFLISRPRTLPEDAKIRDAVYEEACVRYLDKVLSPQQPEATLALMQRALSNPMDLTTVALMLARRQKPDLFRLQEQQYRLMVEDYARVNVGREFPLKAFSERVYDMRLNDEPALSDADFESELDCMTRHKMVVARLEDGDHPVTKWHFRHDKITDYFVVQSFLGRNNDRPAKHLSDARFRGVYFLLALLLPLPEAEVLRERLIN